MRRSSNGELHELVLEVWRRTDASTASGPSILPDRAAEHTRHDWLGTRIARLAQVAAALHLARSLPTDGSPVPPVGGSRGPGGSP